MFVSVSASAPPTHLPPHPSTLSPKTGKSLSMGKGKEKTREKRKAEEKYDGRM
jgi:hypothetical protein